MDSTADDLFSGGSSQFFSRFTGGGGMGLGLLIVGLIVGFLLAFAMSYYNVWPFTYKKSTFKSGFSKKKKLSM